MLNMAHPKNISRMYQLSGFSKTSFTIIPEIFFKITSRFNNRMMLYFENLNSFYPRTLWKTWFLKYFSSCFALEALV